MTRRPITSAPRLLDYPRHLDRPDEMVDRYGEPRPRWGELIDALNALAPDEFRRRWERGQRLIADHGIIDPSSNDEADRPLRLDPMPLMIDPAEWAVIERGMEQRSRLLNALLNDIYGENRVTTEGLLPPALVHGHPRFLRPCRGVAPPRGIYLHLLAGDLARAGDDGSWIVVGDRTEAPAGAGCVVENRLIVSRMLSEFFGSHRVRRLTPFFDGFRESLLQLSQRRFETPRFALLTPGPGADTYFEHAYLSRLLGATLVESEDLTVRDDQVFLKTLDGLQRVDVILRQTEGGMCDPLDFDSRSLLGVAGLARAARAGNVAIANALGSGVVETPALAGYLPHLSRRLLGEDLILPSAFSWWCGDDERRREVLGRLDRLVVQSTFDLRAPAVHCERLSRTELAELAARIEARPHAFTAREPTRLSTTPVWVDGRLEPRAMVLRVFLGMRDGRYVPMPGALARTSENGDPATTTLRDSAGGGKDTWIPSIDTTPEEETVDNDAGPIRLSRGGRDLPSRVADNMFWLGRYMERCEDMTRALRVVYARAEDGAAAGVVAASAPLLGIVAQLGVPTVGRRPMTPTEAATALGRKHFDPNHQAGLAANIDRLRRVAGRVRDRLSVDTWRNVRRMGALAREITPAIAHDAGEVQSGLNDLILTLEAASGLVMENMTRGLGWRFLDIGRRVERATHVVELLSAAVDGRSGETATTLDLLLTILDSGMTYRSRYFPAPRLVPVLDLLLCDESNPRSVAYQLAELRRHVERLSAFRDTARIRPEQRLMVYLESLVRTADIDALAASDDGIRHELDKLLSVVGGRLWELTEVLTREYFTHAVGRAVMTSREISL